MPQIVWSSHVPPLDGSVKKKAITFIHKLSQNDTTNGLHIEPVLGSRDARVRTGRVDDQYRAVMFKIDSRGDVTYIIDSILNHDDAYDRALNIRLRLDAGNGMLDVIFDAVDPNTYTPGSSPRITTPTPEHTGATPAQQSTPARPTSTPPGGTKQPGAATAPPARPGPPSSPTTPGVADKPGTAGPTKPATTTPHPVAPRRASDNGTTAAGTPQPPKHPTTKASPAHTSATPPTSPSAPTTPSQTTTGSQPTTGPNQAPALITATVESLIAVLGFTPDLAQRLTQCVTDDQLQELIDAHQHRWEGAVLLELVGDTPVGQVADTLGIQPQPASSPHAAATKDPTDNEASSAASTQDQSSATTDATDEAVQAALQHAANASRFGYVTDDADLRQVIEGGDFARWRKFLHPRQRKFVNKRTNGPFRLTGGAGTGKTVVLMHRAARLLRENDRARVILTTFTNTLADQLRDDMVKLDSTIMHASRLGEPGLCVVSVDRLAQWVLRFSDQETRQQAACDVLGYMPKNMSRRADDTRMRWRHAITSTHKNTGTNLTPEFLESEYNAVILPGRHIHRSTYESARRKGRGSTLVRSARQTVWRVVEAYRKQSETQGDASFPEILAIAARCLEIGQENGTPRPADHVLVDEGQDLTVLHWQMLREVVPEGPDDLFIAEDANQRIYGEKISLADCGIDIRGRGQRLKLNYRTTQQNLKLAQAILTATPYVDTYADEESSDDKDTRSSRTGPKPQLVPAKDFGDECDKTAEIITAWCEGRPFGALAAPPQPAKPTSPDTIGVLVRLQQNVDDVHKALTERGITCHTLSRVDHGPESVPVMTMHEAKGLEFAKVIVMSANDQETTRIIAGGSFDEASRSDAVFRERSLLYVATSRARDEVVVTYHGQCSPLLPGRRK